MKPLIYSVKRDLKVAASQRGWFRAGENIAYFQNGLRKDRTKKSLSTLTFTYTFDFDQDQVYFAYSFPYTYSDLLDVLKSVENDAKKKKFCKKETLCYTIAGNPCEMLTVTSGGKCTPDKKGVVLTARVHPGESVGSWMMQGVLDFLTDPMSQEAATLRQHFVFKIVPMLNPDGVINGNYRCSLAGCDLNRRWNKPSLTLHPTIYHTKKLIKSFAQERDLVLFCDFHGHSNKKDVFIYGCHNPEDPMETRLFPYLMGKLCPYFSFKKSRFGNQKSKETTARISLYKELGLSNIFTMEASFCGNQEGPYAGLHFTIDALKQIGRDCCRSLLSYCEIPLPEEPVELGQSEEVQKCKSPSILSAPTSPLPGVDKLRIEVASELKDLILHSKACSYDSESDENEGDESEGSDASPSDDNLDLEQQAEIMPVDKAFSQKRKSSDHSSLIKQIQLTDPDITARHNSTFNVATSQKRTAAAATQNSLPNSPRKATAFGANKLPMQVKSYSPIPMEVSSLQQNYIHPAPIKEESKSKEISPKIMTPAAGIYSEKGDLRIKTNLLPLGPPPFREHGPHPSQNYSDMPTRTISPLFGFVDQKAYGSPEPVQLRNEAGEQEIVPTAYSPFGEGSFRNFANAVRESKNYKLEKDSAQFLKSIAGASGSPVSPKKGSKLHRNGGGGNSKLVNARVPNIAPFLGTRKNPQKLKIVGKQNFSTVGRRQDDLENTFDPSHIITQFHERAQAFQSPEDSSKGEDEVQLPLIQRGIQDGGGLEMRQKMMDSVLHAQLRQSKCSLQYPDLTNEASAASMSAFYSETLHSLSPRGSMLKYQNAVLAQNPLGKVESTVLRNRYMSNRAKYAANAKRNLKQWLTDDNYVKNIVLKELSTSLGRSKEQQHSIFNPPRFSVKGVKANKTQYQEFKFLVGVAQTGSMPPIGHDHKHSPQKVHKTVYQFPFDRA